MGVKEMSEHFVVRSVVVEDGLPLEVWYWTGTGWIDKLREALPYNREDAVRVAGMLNERKALPERGGEASILKVYTLKDQNPSP